MSAQHPLVCIYRPMTSADLAAAHGLSTRLEWPHRLDDWALLQRVFRGFVAYAGEHLVGTAFACPQGAFATIGLVVVDPDYQGQGIGRRLMELALAACASSTPILNATVAGALLYTTQGFVEFGTVEQRQGLARAVALEPLAPGETCRALSPADCPRQLALANAGSGLDRHAILNELQGRIEHSAGIVRDGQLCAFALLRSAGRGLCVGPVIAQTPEQARHLIATLLARIPGQFVRIDVPVDSGLCEWLGLAGLERVDSVMQMARGAPPQPDAGVRQFALISQAMG